MASFWFGTQKRGSDIPAIVRKAPSRSQTATSSSRTRTPHAESSRFGAALIDEIARDRDEIGLRCRKHLKKLALSPSEAGVVQVGQVRDAQPRKGGGKRAVFDPDGAQHEGVIFPHAPTADCGARGCNAADDPSDHKPLPLTVLLYRNGAPMSNGAAHFSRGKTGLGGGDRNCPSGRTYVLFA